MKKCIALLTAMLLLFSMTACGGDAQKHTASLSIVCSVFPAYDFLREITKGVDGVELTLLLKPGQESHDYDPSSKDIARIHSCDMFVYVGGESETWIDGVLSTVEKDSKKILALTDIVPLFREAVAEGMQEEHSHDAGAHTDVTYDEHVWTSPKNAIAIVKELFLALSSLDSSGAELYQQNTDAYVGELEQLDEDIQKIVDTAKRDTLIVADRFPLLYFCEQYDLNYYAAFPGCAASVEPSSATVQFLIDKVEELDIPAVLQMELSAGGVAQTVSDTTGCEIETFYACHNVSAADFEAGETYLSLMTKNKAVLKEALN